MREALRARTDCSLAELEDRKDGEWVTVGGILSQTKKIRTKKGDPMMFATLDDLEGAVEILVFGNALAGNEEALVTDNVVLVRGRVDHKDAGKTCVVVQEVEHFGPSEEEVERARAEAAAAGPADAGRAAPEGRRRAPARERHRGAQARLRELPRRRRGRARDAHPHRRSGACASARAIASSPSASLRAELNQVLGPAALA